MGGLHLHDESIVAVDDGSAQDSFTGEITLVQDIHGNLHHAVATGRIYKRGIQFAGKHFLHSIVFAGQGVYADEPHILFPPLSGSGSIGSGRHTVILRIHQVDMRKAAQQGIHFLSGLELQPGTVFNGQQPDTGISGYSLHKSLMAVYGRCGAHQTRDFHHISLLVQHIGHILSHSFPYLVVVCTNVGRVFVRKDFTVHYNHRNAPVVCLLHNRSYRSGFIRGHNQQIHPFGYQLTNVFCLTVIIVDSSTDVHLHILVEMGFTEYLTVHLAPPFILATLGNADTETCLAPGAGNRHSPKHEQKE